MTIPRDRIEAAIASIPDAHEPAPEAAPEAAPAPAPEAAPEAAPEPAPAAEPAPESPAPAPASLPPDVLAQLRARREQKAAQMRAQEERRELEELRRRSAPGAGRPAIDVEALKRSPVKALEQLGVDPTEFLNALTRHAIQPEQADLSQQIQDMRSELSRREQDEQARAVARARADAQAEFVRVTNERKNDYPLLSKMAPGRRAEEAAKEADRLMAEGFDDFSFDEVALLVEQRLRSDLTELLGKDPFAPEPAPTPAAKTAPSPTLTNTTTSTPPGEAPPMTEKERLAAALRMAARM